MTQALHDVGNALTRELQGTHGVNLAHPLLRRLLPQLYADPRQQTRTLAALLSTIATHRADPEPVTLEGSIVTVAGATDITGGRDKISFDLSIAFAVQAEIVDHELPSANTRNGAGIQPD